MYGVRGTCYTANLSPLDKRPEVDSAAGTEEVEPLSLNRCGWPSSLGWLGDPRLNKVVETTSTGFVKDPSSTFPNPIPAPFLSLNISAFITEYPAKITVETRRSNIPQESSVLF
ncbi:hypothetical protein CIHG_03924 [Coccidioides immitis H538.4]|uniref:Uncharacterized protein n=3 Tax=Coccidioides immitis TaxID=5501 RepID=A0A0J8QS97_COCIT|nr:hypothetical protein CIRG_03677 [Coccidioides immitis RMSCC 2394]KMU74955.1 hypothetical protein CISG_00884 [Coccidioides immitis RMSCC 3703]KMU86136.1 hypothetical protein CIHG_03924 [Coccidioides immitis H538.4]